ncbi:nucleotidyltransferase family protein [Aerosakkonemataceae cyanobacterium BLCC-F50]|uniref:Nucleotidyltransferase family protein n=1 Tax=Floridaenema flaviceps BLCC-F50 TaxID=3153642 RepID=A0ABV4XU90_9CYAN
MLALSAKTQTTDIRPEVQLLLCCTCIHMDAENTQQLKIMLQNNIDWAYLLQTAAHHGVMPLLYWNLSNTCPEAVPKAILYQLRDYFHANALHNLFLTKELLKLLSVFKAYEITAIPFKGPILATLAYDNLALRQFGDLDILVRKHDVLKAKEILISQGYQPTEVLLSCEHHFIRDDGKINVDLHWGIPRYDLVYRQLNPSPWWEKVEWVTFHKTTVLNFPPEESLLILCINATKVYWNKSLNLICDIDALICSHQHLNWERMMQQSRIMRCEKMLLTGLFLANELLGTTLPKQVWQRMKAVPQAKSMAVQWREQLFCEVEDPPDNLTIHRWHLKGMDCPHDKVIYCLRWVITPHIADWNFLPLPKFFSFLYCPLRVFRLIGKYGLNRKVTHFLSNLLR